MNIYLNDSDVNARNVASFLSEAYRLCVEVYRLRIPVRILRDSAGFARSFSHTTINQLPFPRDKKGQIRDFVFRNNYCDCWRPERCSNETEEYLHPPSEQLYRDVSASEAAERYLINAGALPRLLVDVSSPLSTRDLLTLTKKSDGKAAHPKPVVSWSDLLQELYSDGILCDPSSNNSPRDTQTVLEFRPEIFVRTTDIHKGHRIYKHVQSECLYCVDDGHEANRGPHIEVYSKRKIHLGIANLLTGELIPNTAVTGRRLG